MAAEATAKPFDLSRKQYESWPWMFGVQWYDIFSGMKNEGIEIVADQVRAFGLWCIAYGDDKTTQRILELIAAPTDQTNLFGILKECMVIGRANPTWEYRAPTLPVYEETEDKLEHDLP